MRGKMLLVMLLLPLGVVANSERSSRIITTGPKPIPVVDGAEFIRACWYQGQQYSEGAPLEVAGQLLYCLPKNHYETNGALIWRPAEGDERPAKITVSP
ncbi:YnjH family protein [Marinobacter hydrocarbonoclasticus]|nr:YnjH family protein [Marinobacter nauticus]